MTDKVDRVEFFKDDAEEWRWHRQAHGNNEIIADSGEGYKNLQDCIDAAVRVNGMDVAYAAIPEGAA